MDKYVVLEKTVGETPLQCAEKWRAEHPAYAGVPLAYAGRLDPMASGKLLILIGEECKEQTAYHGLDKAYDFSVLFGIESDSLDVLGRLSSCASKQDPNSVNPGLVAPSALSESLLAVTKDLIGEIELPYPIFSSKTVKGKPLHTWALEGRLDEIEIPNKASFIYSLILSKIETVSKAELVEQALAKVNSIPEVTDPRKVIGNDFRRTDVRKDWNDILKNDSSPETFVIAHFHCLASSGTYMRTLASDIAKRLDTCGLAWHIHRTEIGNYNKNSKTWAQRY